MDYIGQYTLDSAQYIDLQLSFPRIMECSCLLHSGIADPRLIFPKLGYLVNVVRFYQGLAVHLLSFAFCHRRPCALVFRFAVWVWVQDDRDSEQQKG
jgi:hypothetical protein